MISGWAFRLTVFGSIFCWDFFTRRKKRFVPESDANLLFSSSGLVEKEVPLRTYGRLLKKEGGGFIFRYRPWLFMPAKEVELPPTAAAVGRGLFYSVLISGERTLFIWPPRYRDHEEELVKTYGFTGVQDAGLRKAWRWIKEALGFRSAMPTAA
jgi:hypothetical protein